MRASPDERSAAGLRSRHQSFLRRNALGLTLLALFTALLVGLVLTGHRSYNLEQVEHGETTISTLSYLRQGHFWEALFENWESEFLQMAAYVLLTVFLIQQGSAESKDPDRHEAVDDDPHAAGNTDDVPWPVRRGGIWLVVYENSLLIAFVALFLLSIAGHAVGGLAAHNADLEQHRQATMSLWDYLSGADFWFESIQNWQSEFLAMLAIVTLSIWLRQRGSPESKPVGSRHSETGSS